MTPWLPEWNALLGVTTDVGLAKQLGLPRRTVTWHRNQLGIPKCDKPCILECSFCHRKLKRKHARAVNRCKGCRKYRARAWYVNNKDKRQESNARYLTSHKEARKAYEKRYREENRERIRAYDRKWYRQHSTKEAKLNQALILSLPCLECGMFHTPEARQRVIRRMLPCEAFEIHEAWPCFFGEGGKANKSSAGTQQLYRDLKALGAVRTGQTWYAQERAAG